MLKYFDHNATAPLHPAARGAWLEATEMFWQNPGGLHRGGAGAKRKLEECRERVAEVLGCEAWRVVFTSGATESGNAVMHGARLLHPGAPVLFSALEHPCVRHPAMRGGSHACIPCAEDGVVTPGAVRESILRNKPALVSVLAASNETGVLQPWQEIAGVCRAQGVPFHCDAVQWLGRLPAAGMAACDWITASAHKFGGPRGTGFMIVPEDARAAGLLAGGPQENEWRPGTENLPGICGMAAALEICAAQCARADLVEQRLQWREDFSAALRRAIPMATEPGGNVPRLWNTVSLILPRHDQRKWLARLDARGFAVSTGSACSIGSGSTSLVLAAMGIGGDGELNRVLRFSSGWDTEAADWASLAAALPEILTELDSASPARRGVPAALRGFR